MGAADTRSGRLERALQLLADRAVVRLDDAQTAELNALLDDFPELDDTVMERAAAALENAFELPQSPMPEALYGRVLAKGNAAVAVIAADAAAAKQPVKPPAEPPAAISEPATPAPATAPPAPSEPLSLSLDEVTPLDDSGDVPAPGDGAAADSDAASDAFRAPPKKRQRKTQTGLPPWLGWAVAALCLAIAAAAWLLPARGGASTARPTPADEPASELTLAALLERDDTQRIPWIAADGTAGATGGEVVWNGVAGHGYLRLTGLEPNDPLQQQYQLWIVDAARDRRYPVNGGVFDVAVGSEPVLVPVRPALPVTTPELFAITLEPAGGVVVSDRQRLLLTAEP